MTEQDSTIQKQWTLPRRHFERALSIPDGWHVTEVHWDGVEARVVAVPDKEAA